MAESAEQHKWFVPKFIGYECCRKCGVVRRADDKNKPCKGIVHIALRGLNQAEVDDEGEVIERVKTERN